MGQRCPDTRSAPGYPLVAGGANPGQDSDYLMLTDVAPEGFTILR